MFCDVKVSLLLPRFHLKDMVPDGMEELLVKEKELLARH